MEIEEPKFHQISHKFVMDYNPNGMRVGACYYFLQKISENNSFEEAMSIVNKIVACAVRRKCWNHEKTIRLASTIRINGYGIKVPAKECRVLCVYDEYQLSKYVPTKEDEEAKDWEFFTIFGTDIEKLEKQESLMAQVSE